MFSNGNILGRGIRTIEKHCGYADSIEICYGFLYMTMHICGINKHKMNGIIQEIFGHTNGRVFRIDASGRIINRDICGRYMHNIIGIETCGNTNIPVTTSVCGTVSFDMETCILSLDTRMPIFISADLIFPELEQRFHLNGNGKRDFDKSFNENHRRTSVACDFTVLAINGKYKISATNLNTNS